MRKYTAIYRYAFIRTQYKYEYKHNNNNQVQLHIVFYKHLIYGLYEA